MGEDGAAGRHHQRGDEARAQQQDNQGIASHGSTRSSPAAGTVGSEMAGGKRKERRRLRA
jgi:hypothetical protein